MLGEEIELDPPAPILGEVYDLFNVPQLKNLLSWDASGQTLIIYNTSRFAVEVASQLVAGGLDELMDRMKIYGWVRLAGLIRNERQFLRHPLLNKGQGREFWEQWERKFLEEEMLDQFENDESKRRHRIQPYLIIRSIKKPKCPPPQPKLDLTDPADRKAYNFRRLKRKMYNEEAPAKTKVSKKSELPEAYEPEKQPKPIKPKKPPRVIAPVVQKIYKVVKAKPKKKVVVERPKRHGISKQRKRIQIRVDLVSKRQSICPTRILRPLNPGNRPTINMQQPAYWDAGKQAEADEESVEESKRSSNNDFIEAPKEESQDDMSEDRSVQQYSEEVVEQVNEKRMMDEPSEQIVQPPSKVQIEAPKGLSIGTMTLEVPTVPLEKTDIVQPEMEQEPLQEIPTRQTEHYIPHSPNCDCIICKLYGNQNSIEEKRQVIVQLSVVNSKSVQPQLPEYQNGWQPEFLPAEEPADAFIRKVGLRPKKPMPEKKINQSKKSVEAANEAPQQKPFVQDPTFVQECVSKLTNLTMWMSERQQLLCSKSEPYQRLSLLGRVYLALKVGAFKELIEWRGSTTVVIKRFTMFENRFAKEYLGLQGTNLITKALKVLKQCSFLCSERAADRSLSGPVIQCKHSFLSPRSNYTNWKEEQIPTKALPKPSTKKRIRIRNRKGQYARKQYRKSCLEMDQIPTSVTGIHNMSNQYRTATVGLRAIFKYLRASAQDPTLGTQLQPYLLNLESTIKDGVEIVSEQSIIEQHVGVSQQDTLRWNGSNPLVGGDRLSLQMLTALSNDRAQLTPERIQVEQEEKSPLDSSFDYSL